MAGISKTVSFVALFFVLFLSSTEARDHLVGGKLDAWKIPSEADSLNRWAEKTRFLVGDALVWKYDGSKDSVLQVTKRDYVTCNTTDPIESYEDGNTRVELDHSGPYYFISGAEGHCEKGEKLVVVVMSQKHRFISPAPSPAELEEGPAVAPTTGAASLKGDFLVLALGALLGYVLV